MIEWALEGVAFHVNSSSGIVVIVLIRGVSSVTSLLELSELLCDVDFVLTVFWTLETISEIPLQSVDKSKDEFEDDETSHEQSESIYKANVSIVDGLLIWRRGQILRQASEQGIADQPEVEEVGTE